jgi:signal transduction histidine kinase
MVVSRKADTDQGDAIPFTLVAVRRSLRAFRRFLVVGGIAFVAVPLALFIALEGTALQFIPLILTIGGLVWLRIESAKLERELRRARVRALDAIDLERDRIQRDLHDGAQQRLVSVRIHLGLLAEDAASGEQRAAMDELGRDLDAALADIRAVTSEGSPEQLHRNGVVRTPRRPGGRRRRCRLRSRCRRAARGRPRRRSAAAPTAGCGLRCGRGRRTSAPT